MSTHEKLSVTRACVVAIGNTVGQLSVVVVAGGGRIYIILYYDECVPDLT